MIGLDEKGAIVLREKVSRTRIAARFVNLPSCLVGIEAGMASHHIARVLVALGHEVKQVPPAYCKPFRQGHKNDFRDAHAVAEAVERASTRCVPIKTDGQLDLQALHRVRSRLIGNRTAVINQIRGFLLEHGIPVRQGHHFLRRQLPQILATRTDVLSPIISKSSHPACTARPVHTKYMVRGRRPPSQSWKTFLRNHAEAIAAIDMCVVPTLTFERLFAFLVLGHDRRQLLWFEVTRYPTAEWLARQITEAFPWASTPTYLVRDNDGAYGHVFLRRVMAMGIRDRPISPGSPWQNGHMERLIGTVRRECLDRVLIFGEAHLRQILTLYASYYN